MDITVQEKKANPLLKRTEVSFKVEFDGATPSRNAVREKLCGIIKSHAELTVIKKLKQGFGERQLVGNAHVYDDAESAKVELKYLLGREKGEKLKKGAKEKKAPAAKKA